MRVNICSKCSSKYLLELSLLFSHRKVYKYLCKLVPLSRRILHKREAELRLANCDSETRQLFSRPNQVLGYKSAIIGYTESAAELVVKPPNP